MYKRMYMNMYVYVQAYLYIYMHCERLCMCVCTHVTDRFITAIPSCPAPDSYPSAKPKALRLCIWKVAEMLDTPTGPGSPSCFIQARLYD